MPRPRCCRKIAGQPACKLFQPMGVPAAGLEQVELSLEEYEAIRLADHEGLYQEAAARQMGVSRQTFGRTVESARRKVARALVLGLALGIEAREGAPTLLPVAGPDLLPYHCSACGNAWRERCGAGKPKCCPSCNSPHFQRSDCASNWRGGPSPGGEPA